MYSALLFSLGLSLVSSIDTVGSSGCTAPNCVFANARLRFGTGSQTSVNNQGLFVQPWYYSQISNTWYKLTYQSYPLDTAIGVGYGSSQWSGATVTDIYALTPTNPVTDYSNFIVDSSDATKSVGHGVIIANRSLVVSGYPLILQNKYSLGLNDSFVKIVSTVINNGSSNINNVIIWTGTRDDFVGTTDVNTKTRGNLNTGSFVAVTTNNQSSRAIMITNPTEGVLFYSETEGVMTSYALCCQFSNAYNTYPLSLAPMTPAPTDGSYAAVLPIGNVSAGGYGSITWYYAAGVISSLAQVAQSVAAAQALDSGFVPSLTSTSTVSITPSLLPLAQPVLNNYYYNETLVYITRTDDRLLYIVGFVPVLSVLLCVCCICGCLMKRKHKEDIITQVRKYMKTKPELNLRDVGADKKIEAAVTP